MQSLNGQQQPKAPPRSVLFILGELTHSGAEKMLEAAAGLWQAAGLQPHILAVGEQPGDFASRLAACGYRIHHVRFVRTPAFLAGLVAFHRRHAFDIVHIHTEQAAFWHALIARLVRPRAALFRTVHATFAFHGLLRLRRLVQRAIMRGLLRVRFTAPSRSVADHERAVFRNAMPVLENWIAFGRHFSAEWRVAMRDALGIAADTFVIASVGNCADVKNHRSLLQALAALPRDRPWLYLHVGSSEEEAGERQLAGDLGIGERSRFLGRRDAADILAATDLFVMPSKREGFGLAAAEALSMGLPCVLSDVAGLRDFAEFSAAIIWCDPQVPASIAEAVAAGMQQMRRFPEIADRVANRFAPDAGVRRFIALYAGA